MISLTITATIFPFTHHWLQFWPVKYKGRPARELLGKITSPLVEPDASQKTFLCILHLDMRLKVRREQEILATVHDRI